MPRTPRKAGHDRVLVGNRVFRPCSKWKSSWVAVFPSAGGDQYQRFIIDSQFAPELIAAIGSTIAPQMAQNCNLGSGRCGKIDTQ